MRHTPTRTAPSNQTAPGSVPRTVTFGDEARENRMIAQRHDRAKPGERHDRAKPGERHDRMAASRHVRMAAERGMMRLLRQATDRPHLTGDADLG